MGGRRSDQGFFDNMNLLTLNPYNVDGMKDVVETRWVNAQVRKDRCLLQRRHGDLGMGFV
jgi:hypothetical protein